MADAGKGWSCGAVPPCVRLGLEGEGVCDPSGVPLSAEPTTLPVDYAPGAPDLHDAMMAGFWSATRSVGILTVTMGTRQADKSLANAGAAIWPGLGGLARTLPGQAAFWAAGLEEPGCGLSLSPAIRPSPAGACAAVCTRPSEPGSSPGLGLLARRRAGRRVVAQPPGTTAGAATICASRRLTGRTNHTGSRRLSVPNQAELRHRQLIQILRDEYSWLGITDLRRIGEGMDAKVYRAYSPQLGPVAIKMPHSRWMSSGNEPTLDTRVILRKEFQLSRYLQGHRLPAPEVFFMHTEDAGVDFIVSQFVESDDSELLDSEFGHLIRAIHDLPAPSPDLAAGEPPACVDEILAERIDRRLKKLASIASLSIGFPDIGPALSSGRTDDAPGCLLHMDLRPENILVRCGRPAAILDWSNALVGEARSTCHEQPNTGASPQPRSRPTGTQRRSA